MFHKTPNKQKQQRPLKELRFFVAIENAMKKHTRESEAQCRTL